MANKETELYLSGSKSTGLLIWGHKDMPLKEEALSIAASLLNTEKIRLNNHPDFLILKKENKEKSLGVDSLKDLFSKTTLKPVMGEIMVFLIHNIDTMTEQAQNKLLKTLEDNSNVRIIATANNIDKVLPTIKSRVRQIQFYSLRQDEFEKWCFNNSHDYSDELYFVTQGCPCTIEEYAGIVDIFKKIKKEYHHNQLNEFFSILHLLKEKDTDNFFISHPELIPNLWNYLGFLIKEELAGLMLSNKKPIHSIQSLISAGDIVAFQMTACKRHSYQKDSFFLGIVDFVETMNGG